MNRNKLKQIQQIDSKAISNTKLQGPHRHRSFQNVLLFLIQDYRLLIQNSVNFNKFIIFLKEKKTDLF